MTIYCRRCGKTSAENHQKYCGLGDDKDYEHRWVRLTAEEAAELPARRRWLASQQVKEVPATQSRPAVAGIWHTTDSIGGDVRHLGLTEEGAIQAHLFHYRYENSQKIRCVYEGHIERGTNRDEVCFNPHCLMYGLSFSPEA